jgi:glutaredoxin
MTEQLIVVYSMKGCPFCEMLKEELNTQNIPFIERDIDEESDEYDLFVEAVDGNDYVPAFMIIESDGEKNNTKFFAPERDYNEITDGVKIIKEHFDRFTQ